LQDVCHLQLIRRRFTRGLSAKCRNRGESR
jgi:hypothetical protein